MACCAKRNPPAWSRLPGPIQDPGTTARARLGRATISVDRDTVNPLANTVTSPWGGQSIPSMRYRTMPDSPTTPSCEPSLSEVEFWQALEVHLSATVDLSVAGRFGARARGAFPLISARLLTIEWE